MMLPTKVSVLDRAHAREGVDASTTLNDTVRLAREAERLGYHRFWLAEHHGVPGILGSAPTVLAAAVASVTSAIRVGTGGVMLPGHRPMVVAEQFGVLDALFPGRIDMGLGRSLGFTPAVRSALGQREEEVDQFPQRLAELLGWLTATQTAYPGVTSYPVPGRRVAPFVLALDQAAGIASAAGLPLVIGGNRAKVLAAVDTYRRTFRPSSWRQEPYVVLAAAVAVADTRRAAERMLHAEAWSIARSRTSGSFPPLMPSERIDPAKMTGRQRDFFEQALQGFITGTDDEVEHRLTEAVTDTGADELLVTTNTHDLDERADSFRRLARLTGLGPGR
ncbi:MsnO8 family LLM class oxidoreductase [Kitasatospora sp. NPDC048540]|uniref:MsnO8 family LLM class oxidoreductase n=1 Tax=unclassified Kitasatospora TaxID=2633591 RepID=UPI00053B0518|nr:MsnO8 family LLM class oxidoreductase [Kitasatospora sp. MBT63]